MERLFVACSCFCLLASLSKHLSKLLLTFCDLSSYLPIIACWGLWSLWVLRLCKDLLLYFCPPKSAPRGIKGNEICQQVSVLSGCAALCEAGQIHTDFVTFLFHFAGSSFLVHVRLCSRQLNKMLKPKAGFLNCCVRGRWAVCLFVIIDIMVLRVSLCFFFNSLINTQEFFCSHWAAFKACEAPLASLGCSSGTPSRRPQPLLVGVRFD